MNGWKPGEFVFLESVQDPQIGPILIYRKCLGNHTAIYLTWYGKLYFKGDEPDVSPLPSPHASIATSPAIRDVWGIRLDFGEELAQP